MKHQKKSQLLYISHREALKNAEKCLWIVAWPELNNASLAGQTYESRFLCWFFHSKVFRVVEYSFFSLNFSFWTKKIYLVVSRPFYLLPIPRLMSNNNNIEIILWLKLEFATVDTEISICNSIDWTMRFGGILLLSLWWNSLKILKKKKIEKGVNLESPESKFDKCISIQLQYYKLCIKIRLF